MYCTHKAANTFFVTVANYFSACIYMQRILFTMLDSSLNIHMFEKRTYVHYSKCSCIR